MSANPYQPPLNPMTAGSDRSAAASSLFSLLSHALIALLAGAVFVVAVLPLNSMVLLIWLVVVVVAVWRHVKAERTELAVAVLGVQCFVMSGVTVAAHLAPVKTVDRVLAQPVTLPSTNLTIGELRELAELRRREVFPQPVPIAASESTDDVKIRFASRRMPLRDFIATVESQSPLRHRFGHCGNGWTVLWGGDCSFGLWLREP